MVDGETGFLVPSTVPPIGGGAVIANRFFAERINYDQYIALTSQVTAGDIPAASAALVRLNTDAALRQRIGAAGRRRIAEVFDWAHIVRQYQELRRIGAPTRNRHGLDHLTPNSAFHPLRPDPFAMFQHHATASYPMATWSPRADPLGDLSAMIGQSLRAGPGLLLPLDAIGLPPPGREPASIESLQAEVPGSHQHALMFTLSGSINMVSSR